MRTPYVLIGLVLASSRALAQGQVVEYYHLDALGTVRAVTNEAGVVLETHNYLPFGEELCPSGGTYVVCGTPPAGQLKRFTGKERDAETGLDYFGARYLRASAGRFTTIDPVYTWQENLEDPQRWNRYAYARNNPLKYVDPDGRAIDVVADVGFILFDIFDIGRSIYRGEPVTGTQIGALGADIVGAAIPFATGGGSAIRAGAHVQNSVSSIKSANAASDASKTGDAASGSYTVTFETGKKYHGKGLEARSGASAKRVGASNTDNAKKIDWKPATSQKEAFKAEAKRIRQDGGVSSPSNYNKINSPGEKYLQEKKN